MNTTDFHSYLETLVESSDVECKTAQGREGKGEIPASIWESYSAMANTLGGDIYLGVEETKDHRFICRGIKDIQRVRKSFWDTVNSKTVVNKNILQDSDVRVIDVQGLSVLHIRVPQARRQDRPVHLKANPFGNTYVRRHEGDYKVDDETIKEAGGISDCRNHGIQNLFRYIGLGDHAGSGIPSILKSWQSQHWRTPLSYEEITHEQTLLELRTLSLLPQESVKNLETRFGDQFHALTEQQRVALITAETEGFVTHARMKTLSTTHARDLSALLAGLVKDGYLEKDGETRATVYFIPGARPKQLLAQEGLSDSPDLPANSPDLKSVLDSILSRWGLQHMPGKIPAIKMREMINALCAEHWVTLAELGRLLHRDTKALQDQYLTPLVAAGQLQLKFPEKKNHPAQAYRTKQ